MITAQFYDGDLPESRCDNSGSTISAIPNSQFPRPALPLFSLAPPLSYELRFIKESSRYKFFIAYEAAERKVNYLHFVARLLHGAFLSWLGNINEKSASAFAILLFYFQLPYICGT